MLSTVTRNSDEDVDDSTPTVTSEDLLGRVAQGDRAAFAELYDRTAPRVFGLVRRLLRDHSQSEEVTQEIFLEIWQNATRYEKRNCPFVPSPPNQPHRIAATRSSTPVPISRFGHGRASSPNVVWAVS